jgi:hypothetical protein
MKKVIIFILFLTTALLFNNNIKANEGSHPPEAFMDASGWGLSQFNDFYSCAMVYGGWARYFDVRAEYGYTIEKYQNGNWTQVAYVTEKSLLGPENQGTWVGFDQLFYPGEHIAPYGNGQYRLSCWVKSIDPGVTITDNTSWSYTTITDIISPSTPTSFSGTWSSNHPNISWSNNIEDDLKEYVIYKKVDNGNWNYLASTTNNNYTDNSEHKYTVGDGEKRYVYYRITAKDYTNNESPVTSTVSFVCAPWLNKMNSQFAEIIGKTFELYQNYPNPFNPTTEISFQIPEKGFVNLKVYNSLGKAVAELVNEYKESGIYGITFNASDLPNGVYYYTLSVNQYSSTKKMLLIK